MDSLSEVYEALLEEAREGVGGAAYGPDADRAGPLYESLTDAFQGLAICNLLLHYNPEQFRTDLVFAAGARRQLLQVCLRDSASPVHRALSRTEALFCAIAARDDVLTGELVRLGPTEWIPDGEYEADFCYHAILSHLAASQQATELASSTDLIDRFEAALETPDPRLGICQAFLDEDPEAFRLAFDDLLVERAAWAEEMYPFRRDQLLFLAARHVFVEGLALLALADQKGWSMPDEYAFCPRPGRLELTSPMPEDLFIDVVPFMRESRRQRGLPT